MAYPGFIGSISFLDKHKQSVQECLDRTNLSPYRTRADTARLPLCSPVRARVELAAALREREAFPG